jgi:hypothetical protein
MPGRLIFIPEGFTDTGAGNGTPYSVPTAVFSDNGGSGAVITPQLYTNVSFIPHVHTVFSNYVDTYKAFYSLGFDGRNNQPTQRSFSQYVLNEAFRSYRDIEDWIGANSETDVLVRYIAGSHSFEFYFFDADVAQDFGIFVERERSSRLVTIDKRDGLTASELDAWAKENLGDRFRVVTGFYAFTIWCVDVSDAVAYRLRWSGAEEQAI